MNSITDPDGPTSDYGPNHFNVHSRILAFIEQTARAEQLAALTDPFIVILSDDPWYEYVNIPLMREPISTFLCPSDTEATKLGDTSARTSIVVCMGDNVNNGYNPGRGIFNSECPQIIRAYRTVDRFLSLDNISDGASNTCMTSEVIGTPTRGSNSPKGGTHEINMGTPSGYSPSICLNSAIDPATNQIATPVNPFTWRGSRMFCAIMSFSGFNTILPPNSPSCSSDHTSYNHGLYPPQSNHPNGVNCGVADGSVRFIANSVDTGGLPPFDSGNNSGPSQLGAWGAFGTTNGGESLQP
jgi:hypothetical protein